MPSIQNLRQLRSISSSFLTFNVGVLGQVVVQARGVGGLRRDPRDPLDEVVKGSRPLKAVRENPDTRCAVFFGVRGLPTGKLTVFNLVMPSVKQSSKQDTLIHFLNLCCHLLFFSSCDNRVEQIEVGTNYLAALTFSKRTISFVYILHI